MTVSITFSTIESTINQKKNNQIFQFDAMKHLQKYSGGRDDNHSLQLLCYWGLISDLRSVLISIFVLHVGIQLLLVKCYSKTLHPLFEYGMNLWV